MKRLSFLILIASNAVYTAGQDTDDPQETGDGDSPTPYGLINPEDKVVLRLYTKDESGYEVLNINPESDSHMATTDSRFDPGKKIKVIIHGWMVNPNEPTTTLIREAYLKHEDYNVITVDWSGLSRGFYMVARFAVTYVGHYVAQMLEYLVENYDISLDDVHIIGHSLGAHVAGAAGSATRSGKVGRITGLDPADPFFFKGIDSYRLDMKNAKFVDVIHTSKLGMRSSIGHADFFPNDRLYPLQPGCGLDITLCTHRRAQVFFAESIGNKGSFLSSTCRDFDSIMKFDCPSSTMTAYMGEHVSLKTRGVFYLNTNAEEPYSMSTPSE